MNWRTPRQDKEQRRRDEQGDSGLPENAVKAARLATNGADRAGPAKAPKCEIEVIIAMPAAAEAAPRNSPGEA
ncbi:MAG: hypothetical protein ACR2G0_09845 [Chthoniobacterales bacterium]